MSIGNGGTVPKDPKPVFVALFQHNLQLFHEFARFLLGFCDALGLKAGFVSGIVTVTGQKCLRREVQSDLQFALDLKGLPMRIRNVRRLQHSCGLVWDSLASELGGDRDSQRLKCV